MTRPRLVARLVAWWTLPGDITTRLDDLTQATTQTTDVLAGMLVIIGHIETTLTSIEARLEAIEQRASFAPTNPATNGH